MSITSEKIFSQLFPFYDLNGGRLADYCLSVPKKCSSEERILRSLKHLPFSLASKKTFKKYFTNPQTAMYLKKKKQRQLLAKTVHLTQEETKQVVCNEIVSNIDSAPTAKLNSEKRWYNSRSIHQHFSSVIRESESEGVLIIKEIFTRESDVNQDKETQTNTIDASWLNLTSLQTSLMMNVYKETPEPPVSPITPSPSMHIEISSSKKQQPMTLLAKNDNKSQSRFGGNGQACIACQTPAYPQERIHCELGVFHWHCFRCSLCGGLLNRGSFNVISKNATLLCNSCFRHRSTKFP